VDFRMKEMVEVGSLMREPNIATPAGIKKLFPCTKNPRYEMEQTESTGAGVYGGG